jgi:hypothetical protein
MAASKEELTERAQLVRMYEAGCAIHFPTPQDLNFRLAVMKKLGLEFNFKEMRQVEISGPFSPAAPAPAGRAPAPANAPIGKPR